MQIKSVLLIRTYPLFWWSSANIGQRISMLNCWSV